MAQLKYRGETINVPEADVQWFIEEKGAERIGAAPKKESKKTKSNK